MEDSIKGNPLNTMGMGVIYASYLYEVFLIGTELLQMFGGLLSGYHQVEPKDYLLPVSGLALGYLINKAGDISHSYLNQKGLEEKL